MSHRDRLDECFNALNEKAIHDYEEQVHRHREQQGVPSRPGPKDDAITEVLKSTQVDFKKLEAIEREREEALAALLRDERPKVAQHPANVEALRQRTRTITELSRDRIVMPPYAATLLSAHASDLEGNPGSSGNPWILPWNPGQIRMKRATAGSGWALCGWARAAPPVPSLATVWFAFSPDRTAVWNLLSVFGFHGFFQIVANDDWWNCKWATLQLKVSVSVFQFFWNPTKTFDVINRTESNIAQSQIFDSSEFFDYSVVLRAGELAFVKVDVSMFTDANGGGCLSTSANADGVDLGTGRPRAGPLPARSGARRRGQGRVQPAASGGASAASVLRATGMNVEQEVRLCKSKSSGGPDGGNPSPTRQGRWVRLRLETCRDARVCRSRSRSGVRGPS